MDVVITLKAFGRISDKKIIKFEPDTVCPSFSEGAKIVGPHLKKSLDPLLVISIGKA